MSEEVLSRAADLLFHCESWSEYISSPDFCAPRDRRFHVGLLPMPFVGNLASASVYLLMLNPGLSPDDYYGEFEVPEYKSALLANLKQDGGSAGYPFLFLDPQFSWHAGFAYWHGKLSRLIKEFSESKGIPYSTALRMFSQHIASIELVPYHSEKFKLSNRLMRQLKSAELARSYVRDILVRRSRARDALIVVTRGAKEWGADKWADGQGVVVYNRAEARAAHLTPNSPGGKAMLKLSAVASAADA